MSEENKIYTLPKDLLKIIIQYSNPYLDIFLALAYDFVLNRSDCRDSRKVWETLQALKELLIKSKRPDLAECMENSISDVNYELRSFGLDEQYDFLDNDEWKYVYTCKWKLIKYKDDKYYGWDEEELEWRRKCCCGENCIPPTKLELPNSDAQAWIVDDMEQKILFGRDLPEGFGRITIPYSNWQADWTIYNSYILDYFHYFRSPHLSLGFNCKKLLSSKKKKVELDPLERKVKKYSHQILLIK